MSISPLEYSVPAPPFLRRFITTANDHLPGRPDYEVFEGQFFGLLALPSQLGGVGALFGAAITARNERTDVAEESLTMCGIKPNSRSSRNT